MIRFWIMIWGQVLFMLFSLGCFAQNSGQDTIFVGYCNGLLSDEGVSKVGIKGISASVYYPKEDLTEYIGAYVIGIRVGLSVGDGLTDLNAWVRTDLLGENLESRRIEEPVAGWNEVFFDTPVLVDGLSDLCFGYTFQQKKSVKCISVVGQSNENGRWVANGDEWEQLDLKYPGVISIDVILAGNNFRKRNLKLVSCGLDSCRVMPYGYLMSVVGRVCNLGTEKSDGFSVEYSVDDVCLGRKEYSNTLDTRDFQDFSIEIPTDLVDIGTNIPMDIRVLYGDGAEDEDMSDNEQRIYFTTFDPAATYVHYPLFEKFTTEQCINCPSGAQRVETVMEKPFEDGTFADRIIQVSHHAGYYTDWLTIPESEIYTELYNNYTWNEYEEEYRLSTYAPACMFDRGQYFREVDTIPVITLNTIPVLTEQFEQAIEVAALIKVEVFLDYKENTRELDIDVYCEKLNAFDGQCDTAFLNVYVLEDEILSRQQAGHPGMIHRHVIRDVLSELWGDRIEWDGNQAHGSYRLVLNPEWVARNVEIVAFVSERKDNNPSDSRVYNACRQVLSDITELSSAEFEKKCIDSSFYTLTGVRLEERPLDGMYIQVRIYDDGTVDVCKRVSNDRCD